LLKALAVRALKRWKESPSLTYRSRNQGRLWLGARMLIGEKLFDHGRSFRRSRHHKEMTIIDHPKLCSGNDKG
jgi:hypothetical protein